MIDLQELYEWRWKDESNGLVFPYYTKPALDELSKMSLSGKDILEIGGGASTVWWNNKAARVHTVEYDEKWYEAIVLHVKEGSNIVYPSKDMYVSFARAYDIGIVDCEVEYRDKYVPIVLKVLRPGGLLILDNWMQPSCWMPKKETIDLVSQHKTKIFKEPTHNDWATLFVYL